MPGSSDEGATRFLNVDLDICAEFDLKEIIDAMGGIIVLNHADPTRASLELDADVADIDVAVRGFSRIVAGFPPRIARKWQACTSRSLNIGIQPGVRPYASEFSISRTSLALIEKHKFEVAITVCACSKPARQKTKAGKRRPRSAS